LDRTVAMFQMDMIGRNEEHGADESEGIPEERASENGNTLNVLGSAYSPDLKSIISRLNDQAGLMLRFRYDFGAQQLLQRSDQWSFLSKGIPAVFFFAGLHPDYHTPRDTAGKINYPKLEKAAKLVYLTAFDIANGPSRPRYIKPAKSR
jgi:Zn-dependent M28 family amino/carboxypeptidase